MDRKTVWAIVLLVGGYIFCQALADIAATKIVEVWSYSLPAGTFVFAATFTLRDMLHKRLGKEWARACIITAGFLNMVMAFYLQVAGNLPSPAFFQLQEEWSSIFSFVPAIVIASITAEVISELIDTEVYHWWWKNLTEAPQWSRVLVSNAVSLPVDSLLFAGLGFSLLPPLFGGDPLPLAALPALIVGQILIKGLITLISLPAIYLVNEQPLNPQVSQVQ